MQKTNRETSQILRLDWLIYEMLAHVSSTGLEVKLNFYSFYQGVNFYGGKFQGVPVAC